MAYAITSDTHYAHANIIKYSNRPFVTVEQMNNTLVRNINASLPNGGVLYHLGDWAFGGMNMAVEFADRINRNIDVILIKGNHDEKKGCQNRRDFYDLFYEVHNLLEVKLDGQRITLCHYAMKVWNKSHYGAWHLYGHSHGSLPDDPNSLSFDIGVDCHNFKPLTFPEIAAIMSRKTWQPIDHHGQRDFEKEKILDRSEAC
jgi:calcineurin-like phosphoesterase family protein